jgi:ATP-dependent exoDNAse (exonuclease V) beta subunit|tara:strand:+ start:293 stop:958 length:666 start_codon:yes stop_codon:yes gene_type:complete
MTAWSYSSINTFKQCPKKYYHLKVAKDVKDKGSTATLYGQQVHQAAEDYIASETPIPAKFRFLTPIVKALNAIEGEKLCEMKLGVAQTDEGYRPTTFFAKDVWWRGIADLVIINGDTAHSIDYKTSKNARYADTKQLDAVAAALFVHYPQLKKVKSALAFVVSKDFIKKEHTVDLKDSYFASFKPDLDRLAAAEDSDVWNAISGPLCGWCPVVSCEHHRKR